MSGARLCEGLGCAAQRLEDRPLEEFFDGLEPRNALSSKRPEIYTGLGAETREVSLPHLPLSVPTYYVVAPADAPPICRASTACASVIAARSEGSIDLYKRSRGEGFGAEVKRRIMTGTMCCPPDISMPTI